MPSIDLGQVVGPTGATGPQGPQGIQGNPGPNQITSATATNLNGVLAGSNGVVGVRSVDSTPDSLHTTNLITSAAVADAITGVESDLASIHATGSNNTTGAPIPKGTYFYLNGSLVRAKADIAVNATFTSGTNYETVTAGGLNDLKSAIDVEQIAIAQSASDSFITFSEFVDGVYGALVRQGKFVALNLTVSFVANKTLTNSSELFTLNQYKPKAETAGIGYCQSFGVPSFYPNIFTTGKVCQHIAGNLSTGSGGWGLMSIAYEMA